MTEGRLNITVLTAEDSLKVFRMTQERIDAALERFPEFKDKVNISITRTSTSFENDPSWNAEDYVKFRKGVADADIMIGYMFPLEEVKAVAPRLKWIHIIGAGVEHLLPLDWLPEDAVLTNNRGAHAPKSRESVMMALLMLANHMPRLMHAQQKHLWDGHFVSVIKGSTVAILGAGHQGAAAASAAKSLGLRTIGVDIDTLPRENFDELVHVSKLHDALGRADYVVVTLPSTDETYRMIDDGAFAAMKEGCGFVNISRGRIVDAGIWPVTVATTLLKPGGYDRTAQMAALLEKEKDVFTVVSAEKTAKLAADAKVSPYHVKAVKPLPSRKMKKQVPLLDCFTAPCKEGCPIHQDIPAYLQLVKAGKYEEALKVITEKNPLPFITGTICAHPCMGKCTRNFYEDSVHIREMKKIAAENGYDALIGKIAAPAVTRPGKTAVIGGGPAGMAAAYFLRRAGMDVTLFEKRGALGGVVRHVIPGFRIPESAIDKDAALLEKLGVNIYLNSEITDISMLKNAGYTAVILAVGASEPGRLKLEKGDPVNALEFLADFKEKDGDLDIGKNVVVIGGGNTAMDTARAAKRTKGVEHVYLVYRRTKRYMPADEEELEMAVEDGVEFMELLAPVKLEDGKLLCRVMKLGDHDASGRRGVVETDEEKEIPADTVIAAVGEKVPTEFYEANGIHVNDRGRALVNEETCGTNLASVYVVGDGLGGPATVVEGIRDGRRAAEAVIGESLAEEIVSQTDEETVYNRRGNLADAREDKEESGRCLGCEGICENCVEVCPNRANIAIRVPGMEKHQIIHVDYMCNECGNCKSFCPYDSAPYLDKFTMFADEKDMEDSKNQGFTVLDREAVKCKVRFFGDTYVWTKGEETRIPDGLQQLMEAVCRDYGYLLRD